MKTYHPIPGETIGQAAKTAIEMARLDGPLGQAKFVFNGIEIEVRGASYYEDIADIYFLKNRIRHSRMG